MHCEILEIIAPARLVISWRGGQLDTQVSFDLAETAQGTRLTLRHDGFEGLSNVIPRLVLGFGWKGLLGRKLPEHLEALVSA